MNVNGSRRSAADLMCGMCGHVCRGPGAALERHRPEEGDKPSVAQPVAEDCGPAGDAA